MNNTKIGWIGLGKMGIPMSRQLIKAGFPVTVFNRSKNKEKDLKEAGAEIASTPAELIQQTDVIIMMVSDDQAIRDIFSGDKGLLRAGTHGKIIINMSTVSPAISKEFAGLCKNQENDYLDAPVSGSVKQAEEGQLVIMVGGDDEIFQKVKAVLEKLGKLAIRVGDSGAGNSAKLAVNTLLGFHAQGLAEAVIFANKNGISTEDLMTVINNSAIGNVFGKIKGEAIINDNYQAAFALKHIAKDLRLAKAEGLDTPLGETVYKTFQQAESGFGEEDIIAVIKQLK
ncbi:NAD(P)-dependent oxidoreductase [Dyadobacter frigoris]|uniref:NAD(P)-dependent oxidoreductase n=1 Tax=Dyadobacter frigoris TaxID=2576211 RepID=A0A4U6CXV9_9BACT|nr:NAD(P)-dependent oxidoreductase [Dyadobacter frigoris]TKT88068.1 NAD(P)-dependent oxidoreductase [Dyadobacter frigoris]GLU53677.1 3-hydroxy acid dehydrogenase [Dyadobacter frigoris]